MKWLLRLFTSLCLIFLGAFGYSHAGVYQHAANHEAIVSLPIGVHLTGHGVEKNINTLRGRASHRCKIRGILDDNDDDDDDDPSASIAKYVSPNIFIPVFSYAGSTGYISSRISTRLPFREHYCYTSSSRYRLFRVFRI